MRAALASTDRPQTSPPPAAPAIRISSVASGGTSKVWLMPCRPSTSTSRTRWPPDASAMAIAAATVVFPVPPLPVTMCSRTPDVVRADMRVTLRPGQPGHRIEDHPEGGLGRVDDLHVADLGQPEQLRPGVRPLSLEVAHRDLGRDSVVGVAVNEHHPGERGV